MRSNWILAIICVGLQACATNYQTGDLPRSTVPSALVQKPMPANYQGRISVRVDAPVDQSLNASFSLTGTIQEGSLDLFGPLGATVAQLNWGPGYARLRQQAQTEIYPDLPSMLAQLTGTELPTTVVFDWLEGKGLAGVVPSGWTLLEGGEPSPKRLRLTRQLPAPGVRFTLLLDDPT